MLIPTLIFVVASSFSAVACSYLLPDFAASPVGGLSFFVVCGLAGTVAGLLSMHLFVLVEALGRPSAAGREGEVVASALREIVYEVGSLSVLTGVVYLLAPVPQLDAPFDDEPPPVAVS
jgi:hypothetical protein